MAAGGLDCVPADPVHLHVYPQVFSAFITWFTGRGIYVFLTPQHCGLVVVKIALILICLLKYVIGYFHASADSFLKKYNPSYTEQEERIIELI